MFFDRESNVFAQVPCFVSWYTCQRNAKNHSTQSPVFFRSMQIMYLGSTIYLPALALNAVTPMSLKWTITITSIVAIFYTTLVIKYCVFHRMLCASAALLTDTKKMSKKLKNTKILKSKRRSPILLSLWHYSGSVEKANV